MMRGMSMTNDIEWSGRRDSNPRPSAPKAGQTVYGSLLKSGENNWFGLKALQPAVCPLLILSGFRML